MRITREELLNLDTVGIMTLIHKYNEEVKDGFNEHKLEYDTETDTLYAGVVYRRFLETWPAAIADYDGKFEKLGLSPDNFRTLNEWKEDVRAGLVDGWKYENGKYICTKY